MTTSFSSALQGKGEVLRNPLKILSIPLRTFSQLIVTNFDSLHLSAQSLSLNFSKLLSPHSFETFDKIISTFLSSIHSIVKMPSLAKFLLFLSAALAMSVAAQSNSTAPDNSTAPGNSTSGSKVAYDGSDPGAVPQPSAVTTLQPTPRYRGEVKIVSALP